MRKFITSGPVQGNYMLLEKQILCFKNYPYFIRILKFMHSWAEHGKSFITWGPVQENNLLLE